MSSYGMGLLTNIEINLLMGLSVFVIFATGQLSMGNAGFMAIGAYLASYLTVVLGWPLHAAILAAGLFNAGVGLAIGFPVLRMTGIYLAIATLGFGEMVRAFFLVFPLTGKERGYFGQPDITLTEVTVWTLVLGLVVVALYHSRIWLAFQAVDDDEFVAQLTGVNTTWFKVGAFVLGGFMAGVAGALYAHFNAYIEPAGFTFEKSVEAVLFVILGGSHTYWGPLLGAILLTLLPEFLQIAAIWRVAIYGAIFVAMLIFRPEGLLTRDLIARLNLRRRLRGVAS